MNKEVTIMKDAMKCCAYFLSLVEGPNAEGWSKHAYKRLDKIQSSTMPLPPNVTAWDILERDFGQSFIDYVDREKAYNELCKLSMAGDHVDKYIAMFGHLVHCTDLKLNDLSNFQLFALGPPQKLAEQCILIKNPKMFVEWMCAAQQQQKNELKVRSIQGYSYNNTVSITVERSQQKLTGK